MPTDPLFTPFTLKGLTLRNRIVSTSHEPAYSEDGLPKDRYRAYHVEKAKGGVGLTMIGGSAIVSRDSAPAFGNLQVWKDESVPWMRRLADEVHEHGAAVMIQLTHMGHRASSYTHEWLPTVSASNVREPAHRSFTKAAEQWDLDRIKDDFVRGAQACVEAGLDGIELMLYGHFVDSFWTPFWNHRDDEYGGSYENRMRFPLEVLDAIKAAVPDGFLVGARLSFDERRDGGQDRDESFATAKDLVAHGLDFVSATQGSIETDAAIAYNIPPMGTPSAPYLTLAGEVKAALDGEKAMEVLRTAGPFVAIVADLRMPGTDGIELLARAMEVAPDAQRILLCPAEDFAAALPSTNRAHLFRVLTKPCDTETLLQAIADAASVRAAERAERELADTTLKGTVQALIDILALVNPEQYVRATRVQRIAGVLDLLEAHLAENGPFMLGPKISAADFLLFMLCRWTRMHANPATNRTRLKRLVETLAARPAVKKTFATESLPLHWY